MAKRKSSSPLKKWMAENPRRLRKRCYACTETGRSGVPFHEMIHEYLLARAGEHPDDVETDRSIEDFYLEVLHPDGYMRSPSNLYDHCRSCERELYNRRRFRGASSRA